MLLLRSTKFVGAGLAEAEVGIGTVFRALVLGVSRNPLKDELFKMAVPGFALT